MSASIFGGELRKAGVLDSVCWETIDPTGRSAIGRVLIFPGLTSPYHPKYISLYRDLGHLIAADGWSVAVFASRGQLGSAGRYSFPNAVEDALSTLIAWDSEFEAQDRRPMAFLARSSGCPIALRTATHRSDVERLLLWGGSPRAVFDRLFGPDSDGSYLQACIDHGSCMEPSFVETLFYPEDEIAACDGPIIWLGVGTQDEYTDPAEQTSILLKAKARQSALHVIPHCRHGVTAADPAWPSFRDMLQAWLAVV